MMLKRSLIGGLIIGVATIAILFPERARGVSCEDSCDGKSDADKITCLKDVSNACQEKINEARGQATTLQSLITYLNNKIKGTQAQIQKTNLELAQLGSEIANLSGQIAVLDVSLEQLTEVLVNRIQAAYKHENTNNPLVLLFSSGGLNDFFGRLRYLRLTQEHDRRVITETERARTNFDLQKQLKEQKQAKAEALRQRLEKEKATLARQQIEKQRLLEVTKNDEKRFQRLLVAARVEQQALAIQLQIKDGKLYIQYNIGGLSEKGNVGVGARIGTMGNTGAPGCSTGAHLHLENIIEGEIQGDTLRGIAVTPFDTLENKIVKRFTENNEILEGPFGSGGGSWPLNNPIITQMFGQTPYSSRYPYGIHSGVDIVDLDNTSVKAVQGGKLYTGTLVCNASSSLINTAIIDHGGGKFTTYLHLDSF